LTVNFGKCLFHIINLKENIRRAYGVLPYQSMKET
jgi:hypothetical protein